MTALAVDISNYTSPIGTAELQRLHDAGVRLVIIQAFPVSYRQFVQQTQQVHACAQFGMPWDHYVYDYLATPTWRDGAIAGLRSLQSQGYTARRLWADEEDTSATALSTAGRVRAIAATLAALDLAPSRQNPTGVYTGRWWWTDARYAGNSQAFSSRPLWDAHYDWQADVAVDYLPYGGWAGPSIKQFLGTSVLAGVSGLDQNALSVPEAARVLSVTEGGLLNPTEVPTNVSILVGAGMKAQMASNADAPLCGHKQYAEVDQDGHEYSVEECRGAKGLYVSSNSSGDWVNAGPF